MRIGWLVGRQPWAYRSIGDGLARNLPEFDHASNDTTADAVVAMTPPQMAGLDLSRVILHLDSERVLNADFLARIRA